MARFTRTGTTEQSGSSHANWLAVLKVDPDSANPLNAISLLASTQAAANGLFTLEWGSTSAFPATEDWDGRICVVVMDDDPSQRLHSASNDWLLGIKDP